MKIKILKFILTFVICQFISTPVIGQMLRDTSFFKMACRGVDCIYNFRFAEAHEICREIESAYPQHPMTFIFKGLMIYWENYPLTVSSDARESYEKTLKQAIRLCDKKLPQEDEAEYLMANLGARGLLLLFYADNNQNMDIIALAPGTYALVRKAFGFTRSYADFFFFTGLYNYYREAYPQAHPFYKPFALLFPGGDKVKGLRELITASEKSIVLKAEAYTFLSIIYINYENDFRNGLAAGKSLSELYPGNTAYIAEYIRDLLLLKKYEEAEKLVSLNRSKSTNAYFQAQLSVFDGILSEKKYHNIGMAEECYRKGIRDLAPFGGIGVNYMAYAYFGLSRISELNNNLSDKTTYRKKAMDLGHYKKITYD
jgi:hypothetical protein